MRLRGRDPSFVVTAPPREESFDGAAAWPVAASPAAPPEGDGGGTSRINLRLPDVLKQRAEGAAGRQRLSVNAWLVWAVEAALQAGTPDRQGRRRGLQGEQRVTGWVR